MVFPTEPITPSENSDALFSKPLVTFSECCCFQLLCLVGLFPLPGTPRQAWYQADRSSSAWHLLGVKFGKILNSFLQTEKNRLTDTFSALCPKSWESSSQVSAMPSLVTSWGREGGEEEESMMTANIYLALRVLLSTSHALTHSVLMVTPWKGLLFCK